MAGGSITGTVGGASPSNPSNPSDADSPRGQAFGLDAAAELKPTVGWLGPGWGMAYDSPGNGMGVGVVSCQSLLPIPGTQSETKVARRA